MTTQPTQNPVPSESPRDLKFNAGKIDEFVTSLALKYQDRFGTEHYTIEGLRQLAQEVIAAFGWIPVDSFQDGAEITLPNQVLRWELPDGDGDYYRWDGALPKEVTPASTPESSGGVGKGAWLSVGDAVLRSQLADSSGATLVNNGGENVAAQLNRLLSRTANVFNVDSYGAKGDAELSSDQITITGTDDTDAFVAAFAAAKAAGGGKVVCTPGKTYLLTYTLLYPSNFVFDAQGAALLWSPRNGNASLMLPETFQVADNTTYTTDIIIRNFTYRQIRNDTTPVMGNLLGVMKARRVLFENVYVPYIYWHIFDGAGGKDCVVRRINCDYNTTAAIQFDSSINGSGAAVSGVDKNGNQTLCAAGAADGTLAGFEYSENCFVTECVLNNSQIAAFHIHGGGTRSIVIHRNKTNNCFMGVRSDVGTTHNEIDITFNIFGNGTYGAWLMASHNHINFSDNIIYSPASSVASPYVFAVVANDSVTTGKLAFNFCRNRINGYQRGFQVHNYVGVNISGNHFYGTGKGLPTSVAGGLTSAEGCIVCVDCSGVTIDNNTFISCLVNGCIIVKSGTDGTLRTGVTLTGNSSRGSGPLAVIRYMRNVIVNSNSAVVTAGSYFGIGEFGNTDAVLSGNTILMEDGQCGGFSQVSTASVWSGNNIRSALTTGYGIQFYAALSPRSSMNVVSGFTAAQQIYLDSTTSGGRHCEPFSTIAKASGASGTNYTPTGVAM